MRGRTGRAVVVLAVALGLLAGLIAGAAWAAVAAGAVLGVWAVRASADRLIRDVVGRQPDLHRPGR